MASTSPNVGLHIWDSPQDEFNPTELAANWNALDARFAPTVASGSQIVYTTIATDTTTTNAVDPGATLFTFPAAAFTNALHFLHIMFPRASHSVTNGTIRFRLKESATDIVGIVGTQLDATAGAFKNINILAPFTPTAATHTYVLSWWTTVAGTLTIGATGFSPAILRIIKA